MAQNCISLSDSTQCPAFSAASVSTNDNLTGLFPFLSSVTDTSSFDSELRSYVDNEFAQLRYRQLIGCSDFQSDNTTGFYARYTTSVLCNAIVQNSINPCGLSGGATRPLCAESCASYAESEQEITASNICGSTGDNALSQIRADFTNCALPANSLSESCIEAVENQPDNCGYTSNLGQLCSYCAGSSTNSTDSCCVFSDTTSRCENVALPVIASSSLRPVTVTGSSSTTSPTGTGGAAAASSGSHRGLTGGQIAGIVIGAILGALLLLALIIGGCLLFRKRSNSSPATSVFNQPATSRQPPMVFHDGARDQERAGLAVMPGGRVARMAALEESSGDEQGAKYTPYGRKSDDEDDSPGSAHGRIAPPQKRSGSLSSGSQLAVVAAGAGGNDTSPSTNGDYTSPESHGQSEQLNFFKDYYSQDEIHPGNLVSTLWAYEPRATDEFHLERGDMIKVLGIWDDGWATGVRVRQKAEDWRDEGKIQRDSGLSNDSSPRLEDEGEVKAFPLVCVCLPQHWRQTIEGETTESTNPMGYPD
ncbi:uncharacterized protein LTR77_009333 [Saxophila tyrrhenica]|uniref:SH3 domain-containing protein n=1 Tax=Saxophila tyrrhenica TaxID=1690608 RepID=A0AAV9NZD5_9PEZI|nr:hypothetical protein LTR77_009333 [Saxophila tyrrhenica]